MAAEERRGARVRRWLLTRGAPIAALLSLLLLFLFFAVWFWLGTPSGNDALLRFLIARIAANQVEGDFEVGSLRTNVWNEATITDVRLTDGEGKLVLGAEELELDIRRLHLDAVLGLPWAEDVEPVELRWLRAKGLHVDLSVDDQGVLDLNRMFGKTEPPDPADEWTGIGTDLVIGDVAVEDASFRYATPDRTFHFEHLTATGAFQALDEWILVQPVVASGEMMAPERLSLRAEGAFLYSGDAVILPAVDVRLPESHVAGLGALAHLGAEGDVRLHVIAKPLVLDELDAAIGSPGLAGSYTGPVTIRGPLSALRIRAELEGGGGLSADVTLNAKDERVPWTGTATLRAFDVERLVPKVGGELLVTGSFTGSGAGTRWPDDLVIEGRVAAGPVAVHGYDFYGVEAPVRLRGGVLALGSSRIDSPFGVQTVEGSFDLVDGPFALDIDGSFLPASLERWDVTELRGDYAVDLRVEGDVLEPGVPMDVSGTVRADAFAYGPDIAFGQLAARFDADVRGGVVSVAVHEIEGDDGSVYGIGLGHVVADTSTVDVDARGDVVAAGRARAEGVSLPGGVDVEVAEGPFTYAMPRGGEVALGAELVVGAFDWEDRIRGTGGTADIDIVAGVLGFDLDLDDGARDLLVTRGTFALEPRRVVMDRLFFAPRPNQGWTGVGEQAFTLLESGGLGDARLALEGPSGDVRFEGSFDPEGVVDATVDVDDLDLALIDELLALDQELGGRADVAGTLGGTADALRFDLEVATRGLEAPQLSEPLDLAGRLVGGDGQVFAEVDVGGPGGPLVSVVGTVPMSLDLADLRLAADGPLALDLAVRPGSLERFAAWAGDTDLPDGTISAVVSVTGTPRDPLFHAVGVIEAPVEGWARRARAEFDVQRSGDDVVAWGRVYEGLVNRGALEGTAKTRVGELVAHYVLGEGPPPDLSDWTLFVDELDARLVLRGMPARSLALAAGLDLDVSGDVDGGIAVTGSPFEPRIQAGLSVGDLAANGVEVGGGFLGFVPQEGGGYQLDVMMSLLPEGDVAVSGQVPLAIDLRRPWTEWGLDRDLALDVNAAVPLVLLRAVDDGVTDAVGMVRVEGSIGGTVADLSPNLVATLDGGEVDYAPLGLHLTRIQMRTEATDRYLSVKHLRMRSEPLQFSLDSGVRDLLNLKEAPRNIFFDGTALLEDWTLRRVQADLRLVDAWITGRDDQFIQVRGTYAENEVAASVSGEWPALKVRGAVRVEQALITRDATSFLATGPLEIDPLLDVHRGEPVAGAEEEEVVEEEPEEGWLHDLDMQIAVDLNRSVDLAASMIWADQLGDVGSGLFRVDVDARTGGAVTVLYGQGELDVRGAVDVLGGDVRMMASTLDLEQGTVTFDTGEYGNPRLDLTAVRNLSGAEVVLRLTGTVEEPEVELTSPQYPDQQAVLAMLFTGKRPEEMSGQQGNAFVTQLLTTYAFNTLFGSGRLAGSRLGTPRIDPDGSISYSFPASEAIFLEVMADPFATIDENRFQMEAQVTPLPGAVLEAAYGNRTSYVDIYYEWRF